MPQDLFSLSAYDYQLPPELIAQFPVEPRDSSRLMVVDRASGNITEMVFREIYNLLQPGDALIFNNTKVIPARLLGKKPTGGNAEIFLVKPIENMIWEVLARPGRRLQKEAQVIFDKDFSCEILETLPDGNKIVRFHSSTTFEQAIERCGRLPLPPYIEREKPTEADQEKYQTVYAETLGSYAAPTAGLHFTEELFSKLTKKEIEQIKITLHVGLGTFRLVQTEDLRDHKMHHEKFIISAESAEKINQLKKKKICVGTTTCRALESAANSSGTIIPGTYDTNIFIYPGYNFRFVNSLLTNFHLPCSTLLMLVSAFGGYDLIREAYNKAIKDRYRFFSYGDAMLIL